MHCRLTPKTNIANDVFSQSCSHRLISANELCSYVKLSAHKELQSLTHVFFKDVISELQVAERAKKRRTGRSHSLQQFSEQTPTPSVLAHPPPRDSCCLLLKWAVITSKVISPQLRKVIHH